jgi:SAM-dependent methyltransferase
MGFPVHGIDLDAPIIKMSLSDVIEVTRKNGLERAAKTLLRNMLFDRKTWRDFRLAIELETSTQFTAPIDRLIVGNAASVDSWQKVPRRLDFIYSDDVFEHVPAEDLEAVVENMADRLRPDGLAVISPMIFTGICGGHLVEWYRGSLRTDAVHRSEPWEHLRKRRFTADTYLNEFARDDYRAIFSRRFEIVEEISADPSLGREFLTDDIRKELSDYSEEDLFSNKVRFILRQKT